MLVGWLAGLDFFSDHHLPEPQGLWGEHLRARKEEGC